MNDEKKGIKIVKANYVFAIVVCIVYFLLIVSTVHMISTYKYDSSIIDSYVNFEKDAATFDAASDYLGERARLYVVNGNEQHIEEYFKELNDNKRHDKAVESLKQCNNAAVIAEDIDKAFKYSEDAMQDELYALKLAAKAYGYTGDVITYNDLSEEDLSLTQTELIDKAKSLIFGEKYIKIESDMDECMSHIVQTLQSDFETEKKGNLTNLENGVVRQRIYLTILFAANIGLFAIVIIMKIKPLKLKIKRVADGKMIEILASYEFRRFKLEHRETYEIESERNERLLDQAEHDKLTGMYNEKAFERISKSLSEETSPIALLIMDVDGLEKINNTVGDEFGDKILKKISVLIAENFRASDCLVRVDSDRFLVIMEGMKSEFKNALVCKVDIINRSLMAGRDGLPKCSVSAGAAFSEEGYSEKLFNDATEALTFVKEHGKCGCWVAE